MVNDVGAQEGNYGVRFSNNKQEIEPAVQLEHSKTAADEARGPGKEKISPEMEKELRNLSMSMQKSNIQSRRMENFAFEPVSLPASRVGSRHGLSKESTQNRLTLHLGSLSLSLWLPSDVAPAFESRYSVEPDSSADPLADRADCKGCENCCHCTSATSQHYYTTNVSASRHPCGSPRSSFSGSFSLREKSRA